MKRNGSAWQLRSATIITIIETAKAMDIPNEKAAELWIESTGFESLTLHQFRNKITRWNMDVKKEQAMGERSQVKGDPAFGKKYAEELRKMYNAHGEEFPEHMQGHVRDTRKEISCFEECREWLLSN